MLYKHINPFFHILTTYSRLKRQEVQDLVKSVFEKLGHPHSLGGEIDLSQDAFLEFRSHVTSVRVYKEGFGQGQGLSNHDDERSKSPNGSASMMDKCLSAFLTNGNGNKISGNGVGL
jgi:hypothetical protein